MGRLTFHSRHHHHRHRGVPSSWTQDSIGQLVVTSANNNRRAYRLLGDDVVGGHGLGVGGLFHGYSGRIPGRLLGGFGVVGRLEPAEHFGE